MLSTRRSRGWTLAALLVVIPLVLPDRSEAAATPDNLTSSGGTVLLTTTTYALYWLPAGTHFEPSGSDTGYESLTQRFLQDVGGTSFYSILTQYPDGANTAPANSSTFGGSYVDTTAYPSGKGSQANPLLDADIQSELAAAIAAQHWTVGPGSIVFVYTGNNVQNCTDSSMAQCSWDTYCGYHSSFLQNGQPVSYAVLPDAGQNGGTCLATDGSGNPYAPNGDATADSAVSLTSKELFAAVSDPQGDGWTDATAAEIGDKCDWTYGPVGTDGGNLTLRNNHRYLVQEEWSNAAGGCALDNSKIVRGTVTPVVGTPTPTPAPVANRATRLTPTPTGSGQPTATPTPNTGRRIRPTGP